MTRTFREIGQVLVDFCNGQGLWLPGEGATQEAAEVVAELLVEWRELCKHWDALWDARR